MAVQCDFEFSLPGIKLSSDRTICGSDRTGSGSDRTVGGSDRTGSGSERAIGGSDRTGSGSTKPTAIRCSLIARMYDRILYMCTFNIT